MAYTVDRVARGLKDFLGLSEEKATKAIVDSGVANENGEITQEALDEGWAIIEHGKKRVTQEGQKHIGDVARKIMAKLD